MKPFAYAIGKYTRRDKRAILFAVAAANSNEKQQIMRKHRLSEQELLTWQSRYNQFGLDGLKVKLKQKRYT